MFIRVRGNSPGDPLHEFDVPVGVVEKHPDLYKVVDPKPVAVARSASHIPGVVKAPPAKKRASKPGGKKPAPAGDDS